MDQLVLYGVNSARDVGNSCECTKLVVRSGGVREAGTGGVHGVGRSGRVGRRYPVLIAIDDYNALHDYSLFEYQNRP